MNFTRPKTSQPETIPVDLTLEDDSFKRTISQPDPIQTEPSFDSNVLVRSGHLFLKLLGGLLIAFLAFYAMADYTATTVGEQRPGQLIISNTMTQLWTACFRLAFILGAVSGAILAIQRLFWPDTDGHDIMTAIKHELTFFQRLCVFLLAFFGLCLLFILLLSVNLPQTVSVGR